MYDALKMTDDFPSIPLVSLEATALAMLIQTLEDLALILELT